MVPSQIKASSKAKSQPEAGKKVLSGRIEKQEKRGTQQFKQTTNSFNSVLAFRPKNEAFNTALTDRVNQESLITNPQSIAQTADRMPHDEENSSFNLQDAIPKCGFRFPDEKKGKRPILGRWEAENRVVQALYADMEIIHKNYAQSVISPVFYQAAQMIEDGYLWGLVRHEEITDEESSTIWKRFLAKLWVDSSKKWPRRLSQLQFAKFFSALAEARWAGIHLPKTGESEPGLLAQNISMFLETAERVGFPWANGGDIFSDEDDEDDEE